MFSTNISLVSRPATDWRFSARLRRYDYDNQTPHASIPQFINYDTSVTTSTTGGPEVFAHSRTNFDTDATWTGLQPFALTVGYTHNNGGYDFRIFESSGEDVLTLKADAIGWQWATFRANYQRSDRTGSGLDESLLTEIGEQPAMRHYDIADRTRNRFTGQVDVTPNEAWTFSASLGAGTDDFHDSYFGLQESSFRIFTLAADFQRPDGLGAGGSYDYERYAGLQRSRSASPGQTPDQVTDPNRDWTADSEERVHYFSIYVTPPRIGRTPKPGSRTTTRTRAGTTSTRSFLAGRFLRRTAPGGLQQAAGAASRCAASAGDEVAATFEYLYEPFDVYDFAFDPSVVDGISQPSSLVLGHVYRPYTAHSLVFGLVPLVGPGRTVRQRRISCTERSSRCVGCSRWRSSLPATSRWLRMPPW